MTSLSRCIAAFSLLFASTALQASPLLFINFSEGPTAVALLRSELLGLSGSAVGAFTLGNLNNKSVILMPGMSDYGALTQAMPTLTQFVNEGGYLWLNLAGSACAPNSAPGGAGFVQWGCGSTYHNSETIATPDHPYFKGTFDPKAKPLTAANFLNWDSTDSGHINTLPGNATTLLSNTRGPSLTEYAYGQGWVVVSTLAYGWGTGGARGPAMDNMLLYAANQVRGSDPSGASTVPEPSTMALFAAGAALIAVSRQIRQR